MAILRGSGAFFRFIDKARQVVTQSNLIRSAMLWLGGAGVAHVFKLAGGFKGLWALLTRGIAILGRFILRFALPILLIDELITTFQGGDTLIRRAIDGMFGQGTTGKVIAWFGTALDSAKAFVAKLVLLFQVDGVDKIKALFPGLSDFWAEMLAGFITGIQATLAIIVEAFSGNFARISALGDFLLAAIDALALELAAPLIMAATSVADAFGEAWNAVISGAQSAVKAVADALSAIPGVEGLAKDALSGLEGAKTENGRADTARMNLATQRVGIAERLESSGRAIGGGTTTTTNAPQINITVPPGTPAETARRIGAAASKGTQQGMRATKAALVQQGT
jgi:hypothetical protein